MYASKPARQPNKITKTTEIELFSINCKRNTYNYISVRYTYTTMSRKTIFTIEFILVIGLLLSSTAVVLANQYTTSSPPVNEQTTTNLYEIHPLIHSQIPYTNTFINKDSDSDGLTDLEELYIYNTNKYQSDTDTDSITDTVEVNGGLNPTGTTNLTSYTNLNGPVYTTNPFSTYTQSHETDTDNDGFSDAYEQNHSQLHADRKDIIIHVYQMNTLRYTEKDLGSTYKTFTNSPVDNGSGIRLHFVITSIEHIQYINISQMKEIHYETSSVSYPQYTLILADNIHHDNDTVSGLASKSVPVSAVAQSTDFPRSKVVTHEIGHIVGLSPEDYSHIDSRNKTISEYPSVMNYNRLDTAYQPKFSNGTGFDDWATIEHTIEHRSNITRTNK